MKPSVTVTSVSDTGVTGSVQPLLPAAAVQVQQQNPDATWTTIASGSVSADGTFDVAAALVAGATYRVEVTAPGYAPGTTAPNVVAR